PGEDLRPLAEGEVAGDEDGAALVAGGEEIEEQLAAGAVEGDEAELVEDQQLDPLETALEPGELAGVAGFEERAHEVARAPEGDVAALAGGFDAQRDPEMRFPRADRADQQDVFGGGDPLAARRAREHRGIEPLAPGDGAE